MNIAQLQEHIAAVCQRAESEGRQDLEEFRPWFGFRKDVAERGLMEEEAQAVALTIGAESLYSVAGLCAMIGYPLRQMFVSSYGVVLVLEGLLNGEEACALSAAGEVTFQDDVLDKYEEQSWLWRTKLHRQKGDLAHLLSVRQSLEQMSPLEKISFAGLIRETGNKLFNSLMLCSAVGVDFYDVLSFTPDWVEEES